MIRRWYWLCTALLLVAALIRFHRLDTVDLRGDEAFAAVWWTLPPLSDQWWELLHYEPNPGGIVTFWAWTLLVGKSELSLRILPLLADLIGMAGTLLLARRLLRDHEHSILLVGLLYALNPLLVWHAQDARVYSLVAALTPLNFYLMLRAVKRNRWQDWAWVGVAQAYTLYVYYLDVLWAAARGLYVLGIRIGLLTQKHRGTENKGDVLWRAIITAVGVTLACMPLGVQIYSVAVTGQYQGTAYPADFGGLFTRIIPALVFGEGEVSALIGVGLLVTLILGAGLLIRHTREGWLIALGWFVPLTLYFLVSTRVSLFIPRYAIALVPLTLLLLGAVSAYAGERKKGVQLNAPMMKTSLIPSRFLTGLMLALIVVLCGYQTYAYFYLEPAKSPNWRALSAYLSERATPRDVVITGAADPAMLYYYPREVYFVPILQADLAAEVGDLLENHDALFVLADARTVEVQTLLQSDAQHIPGDDYPGVNQFRRWRVDPLEIAHPLDIHFEDIARLRGYTLLGRQTLLLYWEPLATTPTDYSVLVHIVSAESPDAAPVAVLDHAPAQAVISTRTWQRGVIYRDPLALPDLPPGEYLIRVGLYPSGTSDLVTVDGTTDYGGRYPLATFHAGD